MLPLLLLCSLNFILANCQYHGIHVGKLAGSDAFVADSSNIVVLNLDLTALASRGSLSFIHANGAHENPSAVYKIGKRPNGHVYRNLISDLASAGTGDFVFESASSISADSSFGPHFGTGSDRINLVDPPKPVSLPISMTGQWYESGWKRITVLNEKTIVLHGFSFMGTRPPDGWIYAGKPGTPVKKGFGTKAYVLFECQNRQCTPRDTYAAACALSDKDFHGQSSLIVELGAGQNIRNIGWISVYCYDVGVNFGHTDINIDAGLQVPAFLPRVWNENEANPTPCPVKN